MNVIGYYLCNEIVLYDKNVIKVPNQFTLSSSKGRFTLDRHDLAL